MKKLMENLAELLKIKSLITMALIGCFVYLAIVSKLQISPELFAAVVTSVTTYYFLRKTNTTV